ncbi:hypothetical protein JCM5350_006007 [Sporobolomyces pararoseus]
MPTSSILHTVQVPAFDPTTGQLSLESHHLLSTPLGYSSSFSPLSTLSFESPPSLPYDHTTNEDSSPPKKTRKRTKKVLGEETSAAEWAIHRERLEQTTTTDRESEQHHKSVVLQLEGAIDAVRQSWIELNRDSESKNEDWTGVTREKRIKWLGKSDKEMESGKELDLAGAVETHQAHSESKIVQLVKCSTSLASLFDVPHINPTDNELVISLKQEEDEAGERQQLSPFRIVLPPSSGFLLSNFSESWSNPTSSITKIASSIGGWDIVIMDPPWPNTSATRSKSYETFDPYDLWKLDLPKLLDNHDSSKPVLVAVWVTNRVKYRRLLLDKLFPSWKIKNPVEWYWIKIASSNGEPVWSLSSTHRRCYEGLVLGWYNPGGGGKKVKVLEENKVFLASPVGHSRKPVILDLLMPLLPSTSSSPNVLELFARTTLAGPPHRSESIDETDRVGTANEKVTVKKRGFFLAVGNEAIKFNLSVCSKLDKERKCKGWIEIDEEGSFNARETTNEVVENED